MRGARAASKARSWRHLILSLTARRYLRKRHASCDSGGVTHTFAIRFITSSIDIRMGGNNKKLKAVKNRGKGTRVSNPRPKVTDSRSPKSFSTIRRPLDSLQLKTLCSFVNWRCAYGFMSLCAKSKSIVTNDVVRRWSVITGQWVCQRKADDVVFQTLLQLGCVEQLSIGHVPTTAYIDPQKFVITVHQAHQHD